MTRTLPHSIDAERSVLGGILLAPKALAEVSGACSPEDFYHPAHSAIFASMLAVEAESKPVDAITVAERMGAEDEIHKLRAMGGESYFAVLTSAVVTVENIAYHARLVHGKALVRRLIEAAQEIAELGMDAAQDGADLIAEAERKVSAIAMDASGGASDYRHIREVLGDTFRAMEKRYEQKQVVTGVPWGHEALDVLTGGMHPGQLIIEAGRPKMGKTALAMSTVEKAATGANVNGVCVPTLVLSLEMGDSELGERVISERASIDGTRMRNGFLEQGDWIRFTRTAGELSKAPIWVYDKPATFSRLRSIVRRWRARETKPGELALVVLDYLQLIQSERRGDTNREQEISGWTRGLKLLAKEIAAPIVVLSQLNRAVESRADKRPMVSDLRESGAIEQDADLILLLYRDEVYNAESPMKGIAEVIVGAGRHVPAGTLHLKFEGRYTKFSDIAAEDVPRSEPAPTRAKANGYGRNHFAGGSQ